MDLLWARGRPRIDLDRRPRRFGPGSGAQPRFGDNFPDGVDDNIWLSEMHVVIRIGSHHLNALRRQRDEIRLHVFPGVLDPRLRFFGQSLESIATASRDDDERSIQDTPGLAHLGHALFQGQGLAGVSKGHRRPHLNTFCERARFWRQRPTTDHKTHTGQSRISRHHHELM